MEHCIKTINSRNITNKSNLIQDERSDLPTDSLNKIRYKIQTILTAIGYAWG
jgi:hypothetical protein